MRTVWKFLLQSHNEPQSVKMPDLAEILLVREQNRFLCLWAEVDENAPLIDRWFIITPTGGLVPDNGEYLGTAFIDPLVLHVWELEGQ